MTRVSDCPQRAICQNDAVLERNLRYVLGLSWAGPHRHSVQPTVSTAQYPWMSARHVTRRSEGSGGGIPAVCRQHSFPARGDVSDAQPRGLTSAKGAVSCCVAVYGVLGKLYLARVLLGAGSSCRFSFGRKSTSFTGRCDKSQSRNVRVKAGWLFNGRDKGSKLDASCEHSESANEDILMFFFELDLGTRVQYALNLEQDEVAQQLRNKLTEIVYNANKLAEMIERMKTLKNWLTYYETRLERNPQMRPTTKTGLWGIFEKSVDAIDYHKAEIEKLAQEEALEREKVLNDPDAIVPAAFVSFKTRMGAAICAQTQQTRNPTVWLTEWAPEPRDVYWDNLAIPYVQLTVKRLIIYITMFFLTFFFMIPIALVQSLASLDGIEKVLPFLKPLMENESVSSVVQGFLPGITLKIFMAVLPMLLMALSKIEGHRSFSALDRKTAEKYHFFILINVFFGSILTGAAFEQLHKFLHQAPSEIPITLGVAIPMKATFFITYVMVDGWAGIAAENVRMVPLILFHVKNSFLVKTDKDREQAMDPG